MSRPAIPAANKAANLWDAMDWRERWAFVRMVLGGYNAHRPGRHRKTEQAVLPMSEPETQEVPQEWLP